MGQGGPERMAKSAWHLNQLTETIDQGRPGTEVVIPLSEAALALRIPAQTLASLEKREQMLGLSVKEGMAYLKLQGNPSQQRESYLFLYGLIQSAKLNQASEFLKTQKIPPSLVEEIPSFKETLAVIQKGKCDLTEEDITALHINLYGRWQSLKSLTKRSGLFPPNQIFS